jgi:hypothetical protein
MVMVQLGLDPEQALDRLRARAYAEGRTVSQLSREVLSRKFRFRKEADDCGDRREYAGEDGRDGGDEGDGRGGER